MHTKQLFILTVASTLLFAPALVKAGQDQGQESVVDAARKAQADKKTAPKAKLVIDDDNLGTLTGAVNVVGEETVSPDDQAKKAGEDKTAKPAGEKAADKGEAYWR